MSEIYDSRKDTETHIAKVKEYIGICMVEMREKSLLHDLDKINDETEKRLFDEYTPKLAHCTYGGDEYKSYLDGLKPALDIHYANNRHHPEHFEDGIRGMNLLDLLEMLCDWKASSERHNDGDIFKSIEINQKRFGYSDDIKAVLRNTAEFLVKEKKIWKMTGKELEWKMMDKGLEEKAEEYAQGKGHEHYNFLFVENAGSPVDFAKFCYKDGFNDGVEYKANEMAEKFSSTEYFLRCLSNEVLAEILCDLNSDFCVVKNMENWKQEDFITAILQESCNYEERSKQQC